MRFSKVFRTGAAVAALALTLSVRPAPAKWTTVQLPGLSSGSTVGLVAGLAGGGIAALWYYRHHHKPKAGPVDMPARIEFAPAETESTVMIRPKTDGVNLAEMTLAGGKGFTLEGGEPQLPMLLKQPLKLKVTRAPGSQRGELDLTFLDQDGRASSSRILLVAKSK